MSGKGAVVGAGIDQKRWQNIARFFAGLTANIEPMMLAAQANGFFDSQREFVQSLLQECRSAPTNLVELLKDL